MTRFRSALLLVFATFLAASCTDIQEYPEDPTAGQHHSLNSRSGYGWHPCPASVDDSQLPPPTKIAAVVNFDFNSAEATPEVEGQVAKVAAIIKDSSFNGSWINIYNNGEKAETSPDAFARRPRVVKELLTEKYGLPEQLFHFGGGNAERDLSVHFDVRNDSASLRCLCERRSCDYFGNSVRKWKEIPAPPPRPPETIILDNDTTLPDIFEFAQRSNATLDITDLDTGRLPGNIEAKLYTKTAASLSLTHALRVGGIEAPFAANFDAALLHVVRGDIDVPKAASFNAPLLYHVSGHLDARSAATFNAPLLRNVSEPMNIAAAESFVVPKLEFSGTLDARSAKTFEVPSLETTGGFIDARRATHFDIPRLRSVFGFINADSAESFAAPSLETVNGGIYAFSATRFDAPKLRRTEDLFPRAVEQMIDARRAVSLNIPRLEATGFLNVYAPEATKVTLPIVPGLMIYTKKTGVLHCVGTDAFHKKPFCTNRMDFDRRNPEEAWCKKQIKARGLRVPDPTKPGPDPHSCGNVNGWVCGVPARCLWMLDRTPPEYFKPWGPPCGPGRLPLVEDCPITFFEDEGPPFGK